MQQHTRMVFVSETDHLQRGPLCTSLPPMGSLPKENGAGNKQPSVQHYIRHLPVAATLKYIKTFQYVNAVKWWRFLHYVSLTHTCTYAHGQTHTPKYNGWNILPADITLISAFNCTSSNNVKKVCTLLFKDLQSLPEPKDLWPVTCLCLYLRPPSKSQPHSVASLKIHSCPYKDLQNRVYSLMSSEFQWNKFQTLYSLDFLISDDQYKLMSWNNGRTSTVIMKRNNWWNVTATIQVNPMKPRLLRTEFVNNKCTKLVLV